MDSKQKVVAVIGSFLVCVLGPTRAAYAAPTEPCSLLTSAQVSAVLGASVGAGKPSGKADCEWSEPSVGLRGKGVLLEVLGPMGTHTPAERFNTIKAPVPFKGITKTPLSGVGDDAVYVTTGTSTGLTVRKGNSVFQVRVHGFPLEQIKEKEKALAQEVLAKL